ncbi:Rha family transcriptional regulator [Yersinia enterocolitica]|uniref:Rha family transcriptional regulator n=1 Tax=Yersinia enterocolitica TaxID=630 RepID=UPI002876D241|nr:Rha family transcriptional regulator [Yersinia enterocolitica]HDL7233000.1 Rha family transcriptional regulator [Yersinia enterocolitica]HDL7955385.1 Rha family transcriptional regulator [Yersinia enterocolitica]HDW8049727.1 Rha family transcriptional regulator [Yersinia enterocolitica]
MKTELVINGTPMMGTKEIAKLAGKRHDNAIRDVWEMLDSLYGISKDSSDLRNYKNQQVTLVSGVIACIDNRGFVSEFLLDRRHSEILVSGYDVKRRAAIIDRWHALETGESQPRLSPPAPQETHMNNDILSLARVVAEATASATMKAVIDIVGIQKYQPAVEPVAAIAPPAPEALHVSHHSPDNEQSEYALVSDLSWACGLSDAACRRLATFANLPTCMTNGDRGHLLIHRDLFMTVAQSLLDESTPPTGKLKRWKHPEFGGFTLRLKSESHTGETK